MPYPCRAFRDRVGILTFGTFSGRTSWRPPITTISGTLTVSNNYKNLEITFDNLQSANNMTFRNVSSVVMPSLYQVNGSLGFYSATFQSYSAPNLTSTGGGLGFVDCPQLSNVSMPKLTQVGGGFLIANNTNLKNINGEWYLDSEPIQGGMY